MNETRARFEEIWPVPAGLYWDYGLGKYNCYRWADQICWQYNIRLDTFTRCQDLMAIPEITKEQVFFALCCQMEDPSDDEEDGFNAGVSWCLSFIKQEIAKRSAK